MDYLTKNYRLIRSRRTTLSLTLNDNGVVIIRAPYILSIKSVENFIIKKQNWIKRKQILIKKNRAEKERFNMLVNKENLANIKKSAKGKLLNQLDCLSKKHRYPYSTMRLSGAKTRWGSCSSRNSINLNWKIMFAPPQVIDYLIIHELVHTKHKNHKKVFWEAVKKIHPTYKNDNKWLKENGYLLSINI